MSQPDSLSQGNRNYHGSLHTEGRHEAAMPHPALAVKYPWNFQVFQRVHQNSFKIFFKFIFT